VPDVQGEAGNSRIEIELDVRDGEALHRLFSQFEVHCVFDLASITEVGLSRSEYVQNFEMTRSLADCVQKFNVAKYFFFSTQLVFRKEGIFPAGDEDYYPIDAYGESKIQSERWVRSNPTPDKWLIL